MHQMIDKELIRKRFLRSFATYEQHAVVQKAMAIKLIDQIKKNAGIEYDSVFEIGCGSGLFTKMLIESFRIKNFFVNDIITDIENDITKLIDQYEVENYSFLPGDIEKINSYPQESELIVSNATFQWLSEPISFFKKIAHCLYPNGYLCFTSFGPDNFLEINSILGIRLNYWSLDDYYRLFKDSFQVVDYFEETRALEFDSPMDVLQHIKHTGVNSINSIVWTKKSLKDFKEGYWERFSDNNQVTLTYHPLYFILKKL